MYLHKDCIIDTSTTRRVHV